ncbi:hypothetical protein ACH347_22770 [Saccharopolyspora sp. 5N102]|uniref:hypothetical protein n=1 Tax=Saccharopolyspora sp. 5N102 TaxID=3375155 RepID=UPI0037A393BC
MTAAIMWNVKQWVSRLVPRKWAPDRRQAKPLRWWWVLLIALGILAVTALTLAKLLEPISYMPRETPPDRLHAVRIEAVRTALTLGAGLVGIAVLVLTGRKQWLAERTQLHAETDATERRVTELYTAAANQLASDKAPVRLAGMYALERLAQDNPGHRQTIVDLMRWNGPSRTCRWKTGRPTPGNP